VCVFFFCRQNCRADLSEHVRVSVFFLSLSRFGFVLSVRVLCSVGVLPLSKKEKIAKSKIQKCRRAKRPKKKEGETSRPQKKKQLFLLTLSHFLSLQRQTLSSLFIGRRDEAEEEGRVRRRRGHQPHRRLSIESVETSELCSSQVNEFFFSPFFFYNRRALCDVEFALSKKANWGNCVCVYKQRARTRIFFVSAPLPSHRVEIKVSLIFVCVCMCATQKRPLSLSLSSNFVSGRSAGLFFSQFITDNKIHTRKK